MHTQVRLAAWEGVTDPSAVHALVAPNCHAVMQSRTCSPIAPAVATVGEDDVGLFYVDVRLFCVDVGFFCTR